MPRTVGGIAIAAAVLTAFPANAQATRSRLTNEYLQGPAVVYFMACDGYGEPNKSGDGMTTYAATMGIFVGSGDRRRAGGGPGCTTCKTAAMHRFAGGFA